jgi:L-threonylcarbamoyladenylate synthase
MLFLPLSAESLGIAAEALRGGLLAAFPTETVYGLGGDAFNPAALARIFEAKGRPRFDPLIVHIADREGLERVARLEALDGGGRERLDRLCAALWPGPLTLILPRRRELPDLVSAGLPTAAVRLPAHPAARELIRRSTGAVAAPSANPFGRLSPTRAEHVREGLGDKVDVILDGGRCGVGLESTVLDLAGERPRILRPGGVPREAIEALIGPVETGPPPAPPRTAAGEPGARRSPGQLSSHYAPRTPLSAHPREEMVRLFRAEGRSRPGGLRELPAGWVFFDEAARRAALAGEPGAEAAAGPAVRVLSPAGDPVEAAAALFDLLHELDRRGLSRIHVQEAPPAGLGAAINDRLRRAAARG